jgi:hypothetical protein
MLADAEHAAFDVLLCESMSRIGRDQGANIRKRLEIAIETPSEGVVTPLIDGVRAALDRQYLEARSLQRSAELCNGRPLNATRSRKPTRSAPSTSGPTSARRALRGFGSGVASISAGSQGCSHVQYS